MIEYIAGNRAAAFERLIVQVRGVQAARVVTTPSGEIDEVHVVGSQGRSPKQMVRDIESILYLQGGVRVDHRKVSLVQLADAAPARRPARLRLHAVSADQGPQGLEIRTTLGYNDRQIEGSCAVSRPAEEGVICAAAAATLGALRQLIGTQGELQLERAERHLFGALPVCLAHITLATDRGLEVLLGMSVIQGDPAGAAARAVLDAVNRRIDLLLSPR